MIATLFTVPRSDGRVSVVVTRRPALPVDPEVLSTHPSPLAAVAELLRWVDAVRAAGGPRVGTRRWLVRPGLRAVVSLELEPAEVNP